MSHKTYNSLVINAFHVAKPIVSLESQKTFFDARNIMLKNNIKRIVVVNSSLRDKKAIGIVTEKDIVNFVSLLAVVWAVLLYVTI